MGLSGKTKIYYNLKSGFWNEFFSSSYVLKGVLSRVKMCWHGPLLSLMLAHKHMLAHAHPCAHICTHTHSCTLSMQISFSQIVIAQIFSPSLKIFDIADMLCSHILNKGGVEKQKGIQSLNFFPLKNWITIFWNGQKCFLKWLTMMQKRLPQISF